MMTLMTDYSPFGFGHEREKSFGRHFERPRDHVFPITSDSSLFLRCFSLFFVPFTLVRASKNLFGESANHQWCQQSRASEATTASHDIACFILQGIYDSQNQRILSTILTVSFVCQSWYCFFSSSFRLRRHQVSIGVFAYPPTYSQFKSFRKSLMASTIQKNSGVSLMNR